LCGIADEPFCPLPNGSSTSPISVFCRPADLERELLERRAVIASADQQLGVAVALDHLRRHRRRPRGRGARRLAPRSPDREGAKVPTAPGNLADRYDLARAQDAIEIALQLGVPQRQLQPEASSARRARRACGRSSACGDAPRRARAPLPSAADVLDDEPQASRIWIACAVSMTSDEVSPKCSQRAAARPSRRPRS
jgi:hypothetical protein